MKTKYYLVLIWGEYHLIYKEKAEKLFYLHAYFSKDMMMIDSHPINFWLDVVYTLKGRDIVRELEESEVALAISFIQ